MESDSLMALMNHFCEKLDGIRFMVDLKTNKKMCEDDEDEITCQEHIEDLAEEIDGLSGTLKDIKSALKYRQTKVNELKVWTFFFKENVNCQLKSLLRCLTLYVIKDKLKERYVH